MTQWQAASAGRVYRIGDKVMQLRNNYDTGTAGCSTARSGVTALLLEDSDLCPVSLNLVRPHVADLQRARFAETASSWLSH